VEQQKLKLQNKGSTFSFLHTACSVGWWLMAGADLF
jgi:hypothetical protein